LKSYEAQVQLARNALRDAVVNAPYRAPGQTPRAAGREGEFRSPLFTIVDLGKMELQAMVPANDIPEIKLEMAVELTIDGFGDRSFAGSVERINPMTEAGTRAILVFVQIPNPDAALKGGMFASGRIRLAAGAPVPTLPVAAIRTEAGQTFVWTIEGGKLIRRNVLLAAATKPRRGWKSSPRCPPKRKYWLRGSTISRTVVPRSCGPHRQASLPAPARPVERQRCGSLAYRSITRCSRPW
jgi:RND family efflux transporter MFP subunit